MDGAGGMDAPIDMEDEIAQGLADVELQPEDEDEQAQVEEELDAGAQKGKKGKGKGKGKGNAKENKGKERGRRREDDSGDASLEQRPKKRVRVVEDTGSRRSSREGVLTEGAISLMVTIFSIH